MLAGHKKPKFFWLCLESGGNSLAAFSKHVDLGLIRPRGQGCSGQWAEPGRVAQINLSAERALPETDFMRCVGNWGGQVRSSG
jgi:hypothetical protein